MKFQDILFILIFMIIFFVKKPTVFVWAGVICLLMSMPLFYFKTALFTAQHLTYYAGAFFLTATIWHIQALRRNSTI